MPPETEMIELPGDPPLSVRLKRSRQARRVSLRVSRLDGAITLTVPARASVRNAIAFLNERRDWLDRAVAETETPLAVVPGVAIPVEGRLLTVEPAAIRAARIEGEHLLVPRQRPAAGALAFLRLQARDRLAERVAVHSAALGRATGKLTLRDTRSRWGSCTVTGDLMFSWRLIMAPPRILDYVAAHEVAHLVEMNHSAAFWAQVQRLFPGYQEARRWLKSDGARLHRFRFDAEPGTRGDSAS